MNNKNPLEKKKNIGLRSPRHLDGIPKLLLKNLLSFVCNVPIQQPDPKIEKDKGLFQTSDLSLRMMDFLWVGWGQSEWLSLILMRNHDSTTVGKRRHPDRTLTPVSTIKRYLALLKGKWLLLDILLQSREVTEPASEAMYVLTESDSDGNRGHVSWGGLSLGLGLILWSLSPEEREKEPDRICKPKLQTIVPYSSFQDKFFLEFKKGHIGAGPVAQAFRAPCS